MKLIQKIAMSIAICIAIALIVLPLVVGVEVFLFRHAPQIVFACVALFLFVKAMQMLDDVRSRCWFEVCEVFRRAGAKLRGRQRTANECDLAWSDHEWLRYIRAGRLREADEGRCRSEVLRLRRNQ